MQFTILKNKKKMSKICFVISFLLHAAILLYIHTYQEPKKELKLSFRERQIDYNLEKLKGLFLEDDRELKKEKEYANKDYKPVPWWSLKSRQALIDYYKKEKRDVRLEKTRQKNLGKIEFVEIGKPGLVKSLEPSQNDKVGQEMECKSGYYIGIGVSLKAFEGQLEGSEIERVAPGYPGEKMGLKTGDVLLGVEHRGNFYQMADYSFKKGEKLNVLVRRGDEFFNRVVKAVPICYGF